MALGGGGEGSFAALKRLAATLIAIGKTRLELLSVELQEESWSFLCWSMPWLASSWSGSA